jgi:hypothetical protein
MTTARNVYATLAEYKDFSTARNQTSNPDILDDGVIDGLLESASRYIDGKTSRFFYPRIETRIYSIPSDYDILLNADLQEVITFLNGDDTSIASTEYNLLPKNESPKYSLKMKQSSSIYLVYDSTGESEYVLDITAIFGYHNRYSQDAWQSAGTLGAAITSTSTLAFTMTAGHTLEVGKIVKINNELYTIATIATNTITPVKRGDNGSTAATHLNAAAVYVWQPMEDVRNAVLEIATQAYKRRFGQSNSSSAQVTGAGVVLSPKDIPTMAKDFIYTYQRRV